MSARMPYERLPYELVIEILARLPVLALLRFKSVCKSWYSLITSPSFVTEHLNHCKNKQIMRLHHIDDEKERYVIFGDNEQRGDEGTEIDYPSRDPFANFRMVASCNGLLCILEDFSGAKPAITVWNPSIRKSATFPCRTLLLPDRFVLGFGSHPTIHEYKLVIVCPEYDLYGRVRAFKPQVDLYTKGTGFWRGLGSSTFPPNCFIEHEASQAFVSGAVNWIATDSHVSVGYRPLIVSFNMRAETFSVLMLPPSLADKKPASLTITNSFQESLIVLCDQQTGYNAYCIWVMKEYGIPESWTRLFSFKVNLPIALDRALGVGENGKVLLSTRDELLLSSGDNRLLSYDIVTKAVTDAHIRGCSSRFRVEPFMETLVSVAN